jgi:hypothetical protein
MVISGIMSFVSNECNLRKEYELHDTKLLIDGHYLQSNLYRLSSAQQKDYIYSTDYTTYAQTIRRFLRRLNICKIVPIIVYDGSINPEKYKTCFDDRIKEIKSIQRNGYNCKFESPTLANYVFASVMREFGVDIIQTNSETLAQIVSLANQLKCPLMSDKTDFIVFDIEYGLIQPERLRFIRSQLHYNSFGNYWYFICKRYHINNLCDKYWGLRKEVIPLFATIMENNFIDGSKYRELYRINCESSRLLVDENKRIQKMDILLNWLRNKDLGQALDTLRPFLRENAFECGGDESEPKIRKLMKKFEFHGKDSVLTKYLSEFKIEEEKSLRETKVLAEGDNELPTLPNWFLDEYHRGIIRPSLMNIVQMKTHVLYPQIEDFSLPSTFECTLSLRKFLYGILRTETDVMTPIKVLDRNGFDGCEDKVTPLRFIDNKEIPILSTVRKLDIEERKALFMTILDISQSFINRSKVSLMLFDWSEETDMNDSWTFLIIVMRYWVANNKQYEWKPFIGALILSLIFYSRGDLETEDKWTELCTAQEVNDKFEPKIVHYFSQFQACLHVINFINSTLGYPIREGTPYYCLNGVFLYNAFVNLSLNEDHEQYISQLFGKWSIGRLYYKILQLVLYDLHFDSSAFDVK